MADPARARRIAERIKVIAADTIENRIKDERLGFVTVTDVRVTNDLQHASIFYTVFGDDAQREASGAVLEAHKGTIRRALGALGIRLTPTVELIPDALPQDAAHLEGLLAETRRRDAELAARASGAAYAGDADPYRHPADEGDGDESDGDDSAHLDR